MPDEPLNLLTAASLPPADADLLYIVQSGTDRKIQYIDLNPDQAIFAGTFGSITDIPQITVDQKGRITAVQNLSIVYVTSVTGTPPITSTGGTTPAIGITDFVGSGASHARGAVPDPGAVGGITKFLREDSSWAVPPTGVSLPHDLLDGVVDQDTAAGIVARGDVITGQGSSPTLWTRLAKGAANQVLSIDTTGTDVVWVNPSGGGTPHDLLDGNIDQDTLAGTVVRGDLIAGNSTPKWARLAKGNAWDVLGMGSAGTDPLYEAATGTSSPVRKISPLLTEPRQTSFEDWNAITAPAPPAGTDIRLFAQATQGFTRIHHLINQGVDLIIGRDMAIIARNVTGGTLTDGTVVYVSGTTGTIPQVSKAKSDNIATLPAIGIVMGSISNNGFGYVHTHGIHSGIDTSGFSAGDILYVSPTTAGALTATKPNAPFQEVAVVINSGVSGSILLDVSTPTEAHTVLDGDEHSDTLAGTVVRGDLIVGNSTPKWARKARGAAGQLLSVDSNGDIVWVPVSTTTGAESWHPFLY